LKNFELLFDLIPHHPGLHLAIIDDSSYDCVDRLASFCKDINAHLHVKSIMSSNYKENNILHVEKFEFSQEKYNKQAIQYDFLFLCAKIEDIDDIDSIVQKIYRSVKNSAHVYIVVTKGETDTLPEVLEAQNFVAVNTIELNEDENIISAKKMHGWTRV